MSLREWWADYSKEINTSAELINELIAITTEFEETVYNIGRETYAIFKKNQIFDVVTVDLCRRIDADLEHLEKYRKDVEDFEALVTGDTPHSVSGKASVKLREGANKYFLNRELSAIRTMMRDHYDEIGRRVFSQGPSDGSITNNPRIRRMVLYATHVKADSEAKWKQIESRNSELARGPGFHALAGYFVIGMVRFVNTTFLSGWVKSAKDYQLQIRNRVKQGYKGVHYDSTATEARPLPTSQDTSTRRRPDLPASPTAASSPFGAPTPMAPTPVRNDQLRPGNLFTGGGSTGFGKMPEAPKGVIPPEAEAVPPQE